MNKEIPVGKTKQRMKNLLLFIPNMVLLCARLLGDGRVPRTEKALVAGAIVYAIIPLDLIPDMLPFVGQLDDAYLIAMTLLRLMDRTDPMVLRAHWNGGGDVVKLVDATAMLAGKLLPRGVRRVLTSQVTEKRQGGNLIPAPLLVASADEDTSLETRPRA